MKIVVLQEAERRAKEAKLLRQQRHSTYRKPVSGVASSDHSSQSSGRRNDSEMLVYSEVRHIGRAPTPVIGQSRAPFNPSSPTDALAWPKPTLPLWSSSNASSSPAPSATVDASQSFGASSATPPNVSAVGGEDGYQPEVPDNSWFQWTDAILGEFAGTEPSILPELWDCFQYDPLPSTGSNAQEDTCQPQSVQPPSSTFADAAVGAAQTTGQEIDVAIVAATVASLTSKYRGQPSEFIAGAVAGTLGLESGSSLTMVYSMVAAAMVSEQTAI